MLKTGNTKGDNYKEWKWTAYNPIRTDHLCKPVRPTWDPNYDICMKNKLPKTKTVTYNRKPGSKPDWKDPSFDQEEYTEPQPLQNHYRGGYRGPCLGDSGSGQFFLVEYSTEGKSSNLQPVKNSKFVLASVFSGWVGNMFQTGYQTHRTPCGTYTYDPRQKIYLQDTAYSQSITFSKIFTWISKRILDIH